jgi:sterol 3beta-glucosyltransferase
MQITIVSPGSRGDVQPYVALGRRLIEAGNAVKLVSTKNHEELVIANGVDFWSIEKSTEDMIRSEKMRKVLESGKLLASLAKMGKELKKNAELVAKRTLEACVDANLVIAGVSGLFIAHSIAEKLSIPFLTHFLTRQLFWQAYRPTDKIIRKEILGLTTYPMMGPFKSAGLDKGEILYGLSPSVIPKPKDWGDNIHLTGFWFLDSTEDLEPTAELENFVESGSPPVYVGFGSMSNRKPEETADIVLQALKMTGQRAIMYSGWGSLQKSNVPSNVLMVDSAPHTWLFPRCSAVIHHGGAGTTAAGLRGGTPSIVVPFHGDQPFWGKLVAELSVGPKPIPHKKLTAKRLTQAIRDAQSAEIRERARELGAMIQKEDGTANAIEIIKNLTK